VQFSIYSRPLKFENKTPTVITCVDNNFETVSTEVLHTVENSIVKNTSEDVLDDTPLENQEKLSR
jgi:hypothetical protein